MNGVGGSSPPQTFQSPSPTSPLGKPVVGLEPPASKHLPVAPVEASAELYSARYQQQQSAQSRAYETGQLAQAAAQAALQAPAAAAAPIGSGRQNGTENTKGSAERERAAPEREGEGGDSRMRRRLAAAFETPRAVGGTIDQRA